MELEKTRLIVLEDYLVLLLGLGCPGLKGCSQFLISYRKFDCSICDREYEIFTSHGRWHSLCTDPFAMEFRCVHLLQFLIVWVKYVSFPDSHRVQRTSKENTWQHVKAELMRLPQVFTRINVIFYHFSKRDDWAVKWYSEPHLTKCLPIRAEILIVLQIAIPFRGIRSPLFHPDLITTIPQSPFLDSAHCSLNNPISFWSVRCWRTMIPR